MEAKKILGLVALLGVVTLASWALSRSVEPTYALETEPVGFFENVKENFGALATMVERFRYDLTAQVVGEVAPTTRLVDFFPAGSRDYTFFRGYVGVRGQEFTEVKGTVTLRLWLYNLYNVPKTDSSLTIIYTIDGVPVSPRLTSPYTYSWDSTSVADGTHALGVIIVDGTGDLSQLRNEPNIVIVDNTPGAVTGPQRIPSRGVAYLGARLRSATPDWISWSGGYTRKHPATTPYTAPVAPPAHSLPDPSAGLDTRNWFAEPLTQTSAGLYQEIPGLFRTYTGHLIISNIRHQADNDSIHSEPEVRAANNLDGPRNNNDASAYSTYVPNPDGRGWVGVDISGRVFRINMDGSIETLVGRQMNRDVIPYSPLDNRVPWSARDDFQADWIGDFVERPFKVPQDLAYDPRNSDILYIADTFNYRIAKVDFSFNPPRVTTFAGKAQEAGNQDGPSLSARFGLPVSIVALPDGTLYVADETNDSIREISADGRTVRTVASAAQGIGDPFTVRHDSEGNIIIAEKAGSGSIKRLNPKTGQVTKIRNMCTSNWIWMDVDWRGVVGPKDDIFYVCSIGGGNTWLFRVSKDGSRITQPALHGPGPLKFGLLQQVLEPQGHYPWVLAIDDEEARMITQGFGNSAPHSLRMKLPQDLVQDDDAFGSGRGIYHKGTIYGFPFGARPSFTALRSESGISHLGLPQFDELAKMSDAQLAAYIQGGMGGSVPRPEITGRDLSNFIQFIRLLSVQSLTNPPELSNWPSDTVEPIISNVQVELVDGTTARVTWNTNEPTLGYVAFGPATTYHRWSDIESAYTKTHSVLLEHLPENKTVHYAVRSKDEAGNQTLTADRTFASGALGDDTPSPEPTPAPIVSMTANPTSITSGQSATLTWSASNSASCVAGGAWSGSKAVSGSVTVSPTKTSTYTLSCTGAGGTAAQSAAVSVSAPAPEPAPSCTISASPASIQAGSAATLTWSTQHATAATLSGGIGSVGLSGTRSVMPAADATYTLTVTGAGGSDSCAAAVTVVQAPPEPPAEPQVQLPPSPSVPEALKGDVVAVQSGLWSSADTWNTGAVPTGDDAVQISGVTVEYDLPHNSSAAAEAQSVIISDDGKLVFSRTKDTRLDLDGSISAVGGGTLEIGTQANPVPANIEVYVGFNVADDRAFRTSPDPAPIAGEPDFRPEDGGLWVTAGGRMDINGAPKPHVWSKLAETSAAGSSAVALVDTPTGWRVGDRVVVTPTGSDPDEVEIKTIASIAGKRVTFTTALAHEHEGRFFAVNESSGNVRELPSSNAAVQAGEKRVPLQGEVGLLTQNVTIASNLVKPGDTDHRAHSFYLKNTSGSLSYAEFRDMGARAKLGRYPVHLHLTGSTVRNFPIIGLSIWNQYEPGNKWVVLHMTQDAIVRGNVGYNAQGRGFYMETADETGNLLEGNLGVRVFGPEEIPNTIPAVAQLQQLTRPGVFWVRAGNTVRNNVAVGGKTDVGGYWLTPSQLDDIPATTFENNEARANEFGVYLSGDALLDVPVTGSLSVRNQKAIWSDDLNIRSMVQDSLLIENEQSGTVFENMRRNLNVLSLEEPQQVPKDPAPQAACSFKATPASVREGETATLRWTSENALNVSIDHDLGFVADDGQRDVIITANTTFTLTVVGEENEVTCSTSVAVHGPDDDHGSHGESIDVPREEEKRSSGGGGRSSRRTVRDVSVNTGSGLSVSGSSGSSSRVAIISRATGASQGDSEPSIRVIQQILNRDPETRVAVSGAGSPGEETEFLGLRTIDAIKRFQSKYGIVSSGSPQTTGYGRLGSRTIAQLILVSGGFTPIVDTPAVTVGVAGSVSGSGAAPLVGASGPSLGVGSSGGVVSAIQQHLATDATLYPEGLVTGYFGTLTQQAVERFQARFNIVSSGSPQTTGYGLVGPRTRAKLVEIYGALEGGSFIAPQPPQQTPPPPAPVSAASAPTSASSGGVLFSRSLQLGDSGDDVAQLQRLLSEDPTIYPAGNITGSFTPLTELAVRRFQSTYGIVSSGSPQTTGYGLVGPQTQAKLLEVFGRE